MNLNTILAVATLAAAALIIRKITTMNAKLTAAIAALIDETADSTGKLESITTFLEGVPELVAVAVADALAANDVEADAAADSVDAAREAFSDKVDAALAAIDANPLPGEEPIAPPADETPVEPTEPQTIPADPEV